jgi:putative membrane-bound dehydrogenase-like protein
MNRDLVLFLLLCLPNLLHAQGFTPEEAVKRMQVPEGFTVKLVACEPMIRQPLSVDFDERGRIWVLQYLQYPTPAGLKAVKQDQYLRTVWDRVPEPPPKGPKGLDRITICFDPDENGRYQQSKDFVAGLNLATGFCVGRGGVFVVQPPYLLFYSDKNHRDQPDGDPEVCLSGFGMEDSHSYANSLQWGPDGWLYGAHGSTVTAKIVNPAKPKDPPIEFQQGIWRYHPKTKQFELFAEGGGNTYGLDFDEHGQAIAGTNFGGVAMLHQVQGAYYIKGFAKHGPLHNPHTYGYFDHVPYTNFKGGHVTCGGIIYQADAYPKEYRGQYIAGNLLSNAVYWHKLTPQGSSFTATHGGDFLVANDTWFRPVDCFQGPDGSVYVADWYDKRASHLNPVDDWDKTNGRIYKIEFKGTKQPGAFDLNKKSDVELVELLKDPNKWWRNEARSLLTERNAKESIAALRKLTEETGAIALEATWALHQLDGIDDDLTLKLLGHADEHVRAWTVRFLGDAGRITTSERARLLEMAEKETSPSVRSQLACSAKRLPAADGLPVAFAMASTTVDANDPHIPLLIWWAIEGKTAADLQAVLEAMIGANRDGLLGKSPTFAKFIVERLARRFTSLGTGAGNEALAKLHDSFGTANGRQIAAGIDAALTGRKLDNETGPLSILAAKLYAENPNEFAAVRLSARFDNPDAMSHIRDTVDNSKDSNYRVRCVELLGELGRPEDVDRLLRAFKNEKDAAVRLAALNALNYYSTPGVAKEVRAVFPGLTGQIRIRARSLLLSRVESAKAFVADVAAGALPKSELAVEQLRPLLEFHDSDLDNVIEKNWGKISTAAPGEKQSRINALNGILGRAKAGDPVTGKQIFTKSCSACHTLFGEGGKVGPDLTSADRKNRHYMLTQIVDPSSIIRQEFLTYNITLLDGRKLTGLVGESTAEALTVINVVNDQVQKTTIAKAQIDEMNASPVSLMPEKLLDVLKDEEIGDLFAYLQSGPPAQPKAGKKLNVLLVSGSLEYKSDDSLAAFQKHLEANYPVECSRAFRKTDDDVPGLEALEKCDVAVFFTRRLTIKGDQLERIKKYAQAGKPIVAIRTASHGFQNWLEMDKEILGGNYTNHYNGGPKCEVKIVDAAKEHPILKGMTPFASSGSLYKNPEINKDVKVLLTGAIPEHTEPIAWVRERNGGRVFYTSLGHPDDFKNDGFVRLLTNAIFWAAKRDSPGK